MDRERRLPPFAEDPLAVLTEVVDDGDDDSLPKDEAKAVLANDERFSESDAAHAIDMLDNRGRIYSVDDQVRITPIDE